ncbi:MAG: iron complex outermembrane receptor protein [Halioglobus sp.]|jgi:iron complex outermembrane receptor protein
MNNRRFATSKLSLAVSVAAVIGASASTASYGQMLEEVIVTAQKREQSLQDVPIAVTAFSGAMLEKTGVKDMFDLQTNAPSLIVGQTQTATNTTFSIRGIFTSSQNFGLEPSVGLYVDGVYRARQGSMINNMVDVASVEVLRGPQGTLFGRNSPAGAIQINSAGPDFEGTGFIEASVGDYGLLGTSGAKSFTLIEDVLAVRATGFYMERDGYVDWIGPDGIEEDDAINDKDRWGGRLQALYTPTDDLTVRMILDHSEVDETCCAAGSWKSNRVPLGGGETPTALGAGPTDQFADDLGGTVLTNADFYDYRVTAGRPPSSANEDEGLTLQVDWDTELFLVTSITGYRTHDAQDDADILFLNLDGAYRTNDAEQEQLTQELRFTGEGERFNYVAGLYYYHQDLINDRTTSVGDDAAQILLGFPNNLFIGGTGSRDINEQEHESYAIFGQGDFNITDTLVLTAGLRWTYEEKEMSNVFTQDLPLVGGDPGDNAGFLLFPPFSPTPDLTEDFDDDQITGTIKLSWFVTDDIMLYGSYGTGYKSGGANTDRIPPTVNTLFDAETSESFEVGMKAEFPDQALRVNVAVHATTTDELQTVSFQGGGFTLANAGSAETYGLETDISWLPAENTTLTLAYAYNHGEYTDFEDGPCWTGEPWHTGQPDPGDPDPLVEGGCDRSGGDIAGNPENVVVGSVNQDFQLDDDMSGFIYAEYAWTDERMTDVNNDPEKYDGAYGLFNMRAGIRYEPWDTSMSFWGRNLTNEEFTTTIADSPGQTGRYNAYYSEPLTWGFSVRKDF